MEKKQQLIALWRQNFHDPEEFIQFYFDKKYSDRNSLVYEENGKALSALLMLPYPINWSGETLTTSYISGACTMREARNRGLMTFLLQKAFQEMNKQGIAFSTLIPAEERLFKYYGNLGYAPIFDHSVEKYRITPEVISSQGQSPVKYDPHFTAHLFQYFNQKMESRNCCIQHPQDDYQAIVEEIYLSGGRLIATFNSNIPTGWAIAIPERDKIKIKEIFFNSPEDKKTILETAFQIWHIPTIECFIPPTESSQSYGMARITDVQQLLQLQAQKHPDLSVSIKVNDPHLPANQGIYHLSQGTCVKAPQTDNPADIETDIPTLTKALTGYHIDQLPQSLSSISSHEVPYMSLMMD
ncbi:MAG: GNAT family N-acetyltransferase [Odoribacter sp.]